MALHIKLHGGDAEKSLAAIPASRSTRERLAALGDPELTGKLTGSAPTRPRPTPNARPRTPSVPRRPTVSDSAFSARTPEGASAPCSSPLTPN